MKTELEERLKQEAQIQAQEARSQRATVREIYQAVTGRTGEPGDWNGVKPVLTLIEERDTLRAQVREIPDLLVIAHMQGAEQAKDQIQALRAQIEALDCRLVGRVAELSGSHCPADKPCDRCVAERRIEELSHAYAVQGLALEDLTAERDRYREALRKLLPEQDPLDAEIVCDYCGATVPFDEAQNEHKEDCPWLMTYGTKDPK